MMSEKYVHSACVDAVENTSSELVALLSGGIVVDLFKFGKALVAAEFADQTGLNNALDKSLLDSEKTDNLSKIVNRMVKHNPDKYYKAYLDILQDFLPLQSLQEKIERKYKSALQPDTNTSAELGGSPSPSKKQRISIEITTLTELKAGSPEYTRVESRVSMCVLPNCYQVKYTDASGFTHERCSKSCVKLAQQQGISIEITTLTELKAGSTEYTRVESDFRKNWARGKGHCPNIAHIFSVKNTKLEMRWKQYQQKLTSNGSPSNTEEHYHGTSIACDLANTKAMCSDGQCGVCGVSKSGFKKTFFQSNIQFVRFGKGFYVAPNSSKCHDYTQGRHMHRAMLLCDVVPGNKYILTKTNEKLPGPPQRYDSVHGQAGHSLNYEELVLYHEESILPKYVIMYQKDGVCKISK